MTSPRIRRIAADSNALLAAICGRAASKLFAIDPPIEVITTQANIVEVEEYLPAFAERYGIDVGVAELALASLPIEVYSETDYITHVQEARSHLAERDPDDVHLAALALKFDVPIWSNDPDLKELPNTSVYTTAELLAVLGIRSKK